jgi:hypothetical protein
MKARKPKAVAGEGRQAVREVLAMAAGYWKNEGVLLRGLQRLLGVDVTTEEMRAWVEWNVAEDFVCHRWNEEQEWHEWKITKHGLAQEELGE